MLLKSVVATDAYLSGHGEKKNNFSEALNIFKSTTPANLFIGVSQPTWKSLNDRLQKLMAHNRTAVSRNISASGIIEVRGEREEILDDIMHTVDKMDDKRREEREE